MNLTGLNIHGGDVQLYGIDSLPTELTPCKSIESRIIARGETSGHCHVLTGNVEMFEDADGNKYAVVNGDGAYHQHYKEVMLTEQTFTENRNISNADHTKPCWIPAGKYKIGIDQQYDPTNGFLTKNRD